MTMADCYAEGTPQPHLDLEARVDAAGGPRKGRVYSFGYPSVVLKCEFSRSSGLHEFVCCDAPQRWRGHQNPHPGRAITAATTAPWRHGRAARGGHPRSMHRIASPLGEYYF
ncbi:hypothetical protein Taro_006997 [Colocasia esculenta]|uniref:Uncharacterized protein n=1 Tax=Colocasia esculenta TaxID=4460 RepID=A0A843TZ14_COLES|nr:hypothetical protein [Colocasia esculenta]